MSTCAMHILAPLDSDMDPGLRSKRSHPKKVIYLEDGFLETNSKARDLTHLLFPALARIASLLGPLSCFRRNFGSRHLVSSLFCPECSARADQRNGCRMADAAQTQQSIAREVSL